MQIKVSTITHMLSDHEHNTKINSITSKDKIIVIMIIIFTTISTNTEVSLRVSEWNVMHKNVKMTMNAFTRNREKRISSVCRNNDKTTKPPEMTWTVKTTKVVKVEEDDNDKTNNIVIMSNMNNDFVVHLTMLITVADTFIDRILHTWMSNLVEHNTKVRKALQIINLIVVIIGDNFTKICRGNEPKLNYEGKKGIIITTMKDRKEVECNY